MPAFNPSTVAWVPVVDISRHQGRVDFVKMRTAGIQGLILRIAHGLTLDDRAAEYYQGTVAAGFDPAAIGFYPFINPKRGSAQATARFAVEQIETIRGDLDFLYMLDVENYRNESPNPGLAPVYGPAFATYIRQHIATVKTMAPKARVIGYSNRAYWNGKVAGAEWVGDDQLASELEWIIARYPVYSAQGYVAKPLPATTAGWDEWAFKVAPDGPFPPRGASWAGWQFSAGYNAQGAVYGASSSDLDLNIVHPDAWARWTAAAPVFPPPTPIPPEDDMIVTIFELVDSKAAFVGDTQINGLASTVRWSGAGDQKWADRRASLISSGARVIQASIGNLINFALDGPLPSGDPDHVWTGDEFANTAEIQDRVKPVAAEDEQARRDIEFVRTELITRDARGERDRALFLALSQD